jgi:hypothetical protein
MVKAATWRALIACAVFVSGSISFADDKAGALSAQDRAAIQQLVADYATALGTCAAEDYARLFEPDGTFASGPRGAVRGRERLIALVQSERQCNGNGERRARPAPTVDVQPAPGGAVGKAVLGPDGTYADDLYVKTKNGWRFKLRQIITGQEKTATLTGDDFTAIRKLAGDGQPEYGDLWVNTPDGWRFRSSGVVIATTPTAVTGRA